MLVKDCQTGNVVQRRTALTNLTKNNISKMYFWPKSTVHGNDIVSRSSKLTTFRFSKYIFSCVMSLL